MLWRCWLARATSNLRYAHSISSNKSLHSSLLLRHPPSHTPLFSNPNSNSDLIFQTFRFLSTNRNGNNNGDDSNPPNSTSWNLTPDEEGDSIFQDEGNLAGLVDDKGSIESKPSKQAEISLGGGEDWKMEFDLNKSDGGDIFGGVESSKSGGGGGGGDDEWKTVEGYTPWSFGDEEKNEVFDIGEGIEGLPPSRIDDYTEKENAEANRKLEEEKQQLLLKLNGPTRAFGDLIALSGMTDAMVDSLMLLKDLRGVEESPPQQSEQEKKRLAKHKVKIARSEIERKKQEEIDKSRVRRVDDKGRAYGTGRRKCSVARVFIQPGDGKFIINDKQFDAYFPVLDHRADLLRPFSETKTLGLWDVNCTVKGGGVSGQVGAIRLGISRALENWEPGLRPSLKAVGFLTRDPRMVERKKPGKAKARKSYQWVKR